MVTCQLDPEPDTSRTRHQHCHYGEEGKGEGDEPEKYGAVLGKVQAECEEECIVKSFVIVLL